MDSVKHPNPKNTVAARAGRAPSRHGLDALEARTLMSFSYSDLSGLINPPGPTAFSEGYNGPLAVIGDVDGDDVPDLLAGLSGTWSSIKTGGEFSGAAVFSGRTGATIRTHQPDVRSFGWSVAALGDINGDGSPDYGIGTSVGFGAPRVTVYDGASGALMHTFTLGDTGEPDQPGATVAGPGDVDGDGRADILVGYPGQNQARIYSGFTGAVLHTFIGTDYGVTERFGLAVAGGAGLDGEFGLAGADLSHTGGRDFLIAGANRIVAFSGDLADDVYFIPLATPVPDFSSIGLSIVRDVVLDDTDAFAVFQDGSLTIHDGFTGGTVRTYTGSADAPFTGAYTVVGDYNGDGARDLAIGSSGYTAVGVPDDLGFSPQGAIGIYSATDGSRLAFLTDHSELSRVPGTSGAQSYTIGDFVAAADFNGDGLPDLLSSSEYNPEYGGPGTRKLIRFDGSFLVDAPVMHGQMTGPDFLYGLSWGSLATADFIYANGKVVFIESLEGLSRGDRILAVGTGDDTLTLAVARGGQISDAVLWVGRADFTRRGLLVMDELAASGGPAGTYELARFAAVLEDSAYIERTRDGTTATTWRVTFLDAGGVVVSAQEYLFDGRPVDAAEGVDPSIDEIVVAIAGDDPADTLVKQPGQEAVRLENFTAHDVSGRGIVIGLAQRTGDPAPRPYAIKLESGIPGTPLALRVPEGGTAWRTLRFTQDGSVTGEFTDAGGRPSIFINYFQALTGGSEAEVVDLRSAEIFGAPEDFLDRDPALAFVGLSGGEFVVTYTDFSTGLARTAVLNDVNHFPSRRSGLGSTFVASPDGRAVVVASAAGGVTAFYRVTFASSPRWQSVAVTSGEKVAAGEPAVQLHTGSMTTWTLPSGTNLPYIAIATSGGLILLEPTIYMQGGGGGGPAFPFDAYNVRNLTQEIPGAEAITQSLSTMLPLNGLRLLSGLTADGDLVLYGLNRPIETAVTGLQEPFTWSYANLYDQVLRPGGLPEPDFDVENNGALVSYVTAWGGLNVAGVAGVAGGEIISFWTAPGLQGWQVANLSDAITSSTPNPDGLRNLSVYLTPWGGINLVGADRLDVYWWAPGLGGEWRYDTLSSIAPYGPLLQSGTITSYVTPWGGLNIAGLDAQNQLWVYWWAPESPTWRAESLDVSLSAADRLIPHVGSLESAVGESGELNIFARDGTGNPLRYFWSPGASWALENLNFPQLNPA